MNEYVIAFYHQMRNFSAISWRKQVTFNAMMISALY